MSLIKIATLRTWSSIPGHELFLRQLDTVRKMVQSTGKGRIFLQSPDKTNTLVALTAKELNQDVYKIDLPAILSKFVGETKRNLDKVFAQVEGKEWILYFDEADALFGKRAGINPGEDKYSNLYVPYLLKKIEEYKGVVIFSCINCLAAIGKVRDAVLLNYFPT